MLENAALRGADRRARPRRRRPALGEITGYSLAVAVVAVTGLVRRRLDLAIAAAGVIVGGQLIRPPALRRR